ncbi:MAG: DUF86 domain-containing protein [Fusobacteriaceae bacterium]|jgi:uncharacterized protein with HEPN domain|nr:DUF86 domain-containing protein [Fusobacteriaceae bacterium]
MDELTRALLTKIIYRANRIIRYVSGCSLEMFLDNEMAQDGVCMNLLNIGELVKQLPQSVRQQYADIPWKKITGLRDITAHGYDSLRINDIWGTATKDVPVLICRIKTILEE